MTVYYILTAVIFGLAYPMCVRKPSEKKNLIYVCAVFFCMFLLSSFRYGIGYDYFTYRKMLRLSAEGQPQSDLEPGYNILMKIACLFGGEYLFLNILTALLILAPAAYIIIRYSKMPWISCWLYLAITFFYASMNFTRQSLAVAFMFLSWPFIKEKKHIAVILIIAASSLFHMSVLVLIPIYLMSLIKPTAKSLGIIGAVGLLVFIFSNKLIYFALNVVFKKYSKYLGTIFLTEGLSWVYLVIPFLLMAVTLTAYFMGWRDKCPYSAVLTNFSFYNFFIWLFIVKHFILERFSMPVYIFMLITIPEVLCFFKEQIGEDMPPLKGKHFKQPEKPVRSGFWGKNRIIYYSAAAVVIISTVIYNRFCMGEMVHGVIPYKSIFDAAPEATAKARKTNYRMLLFGPSLQECMSIVNKGDYTTVICVKGNAGDTLDLPSRMILRIAGFKTDFNSLDGKSYVGAVCNGKTLFEITSEDIISEKFTVCDNTLRVCAISGGARASEQYGMVFVGDDMYTPDTNGLNIAIFDNKLQKIAGAVAYDTTDYNYPCTKTTAFNGEILISEKNY